MTLGAIEGVCRLLDVDFAHEEEHWWQAPPYYRAPMVPTGEAFFRRSGPEEWSGRVLFTEVERLGYRPNPYTNEVAIHVRYDEQGFRNPPELADWTLAVAGDSFTELGFLPEDQLFTSMLSKALGEPVRNLGVGYTGPLTQLSYLQRFGIAPGTGRVMMIFFEGNDLEDLAEERAALEEARAGGRPPPRVFRRQPSFLRALYQAANDLIQGPPRLANARFHSAHGPVPVTLIYAPPGCAGPEGGVPVMLDELLADYAGWATRKDVEPWLAFIPSKERVLHGRVDFEPHAPEAVRTWTPTKLPECVGKAAHRHGVRFIDLSPALVEETHRTGELTYNGIYDTHLNARGSDIVARELARHLSTKVPPTFQSQTGPARAGRGPYRRTRARHRVASRR